MSLKLNLGCGSHLLEGWTNVDLLRGAGIQPDLQADILKLKDHFQEHPLFPSPVDEILASHVLEHLEWSTDPLWDWVSLLKPGGRLVAVVPDVLQASLLADSGHIGKEWLRDVVLGMDYRSGQDELLHRRAYTPNLLVQELRGHGLVSVVRVVRGHPRWRELVAEGVLRSGAEEQVVCEGWKEGAQ